MELYKSEIYHISKLYRMSCIFEVSTYHRRHYCEPSSPWVDYPYWVMWLSHKAFSSLHRPQYESCMFSTTLMHLKAATSTHTQPHNEQDMGFPCFLQCRQKGLFQSVGLNRRITVSVALSVEFMWCHAKIGFIWLTSHFYSLKKLVEEWLIN